MNKNIKDKWIAALKSGEYKQTTEHLKDDEGFCCLGVLTDLYLQEHKLGWVDVGTGYYAAPDPISGHKERMAHQVLPKCVVKWADLPHDCPHPPGHAYSLAELNDKGGYDFEDIASVIEECF